MNRKLAIIIGLQAFLIVMLFWLLVFYGKDEFEAMSEQSEEEIETINRVADKDGATIISISPAAQKQSDILTSPLKASSHQASISTYGNVVSIDSLIELRNRYLAVKSEIDVLRATFNHNKSELERFKTLNQDNKNVSDKVVAAAAANTRSDETKIAAAESNAKNIADSIRQQWGDTLAQHAINPKTSDLLQALISNKKVLIQTTLPFDAAEPKSNSSIMIAPTAAPSHTMRADYISPAPITNTTIQGKTYFYHAVTSELRAGMQINATTATSSKKSNGVIVPNNAIIWYAGKPWVYQKTGADQFSRKPIHTDIEVEDGWFYQGHLKANDEVVISGAQLLLSEEFKSQIMNENDD
ncbi:efflux RND transporter periplasmic adaptor subunit [Methylotenera sp. L2L1]|uniref:efflux RND transporter periplasmic adaptor subunit n=1 Tax=Methylotenera sp. L2L1 TaxID=1502770 RepID=UPI00056D4F03|nr:efflux RND transporter periplasmic adaptor subunit [Methylotenera sp. L2L1]